MVAPAIAWAASRWKEPGKMASRANICCSSTESSRQERSKTACNVRCSWGKSRVSASKKSRLSTSSVANSRQLNIGNMLVASSMPNGKPSTSRQICTSGSMVSAFRPKLGSRCCARWRNIATASLSAPKFCTASAHRLAGTPCARFCLGNVGSDSFSSGRMLSPRTFSDVREVASTLTWGAWVKS